MTQYDGHSYSNQGDDFDVEDLKQRQGADADSQQPAWEAGTAAWRRLPALSCVAVLPPLWSQGLQHETRAR